MKRRPLLQALTLACAWPASGTFAQSSARTVRIITALPAGSAIDIQARTLAPFLSASLEQPVIVENKPGGRDIIAATEVLKSPADGTTLFMGSQSPLALNVALVKNLPYDPRKDLTPIAGVSSVNHILVVKSNFPAKTFQEFLSYAKQHPGKVSMGYGTTLVQMQIASVSKGAGVDLLAVPYKGTPGQITDLLGDILTATFLDPGNALPQIKSGAMRALAVTSLKRNPLTPDIPAVSETLPGFDFAAWTAMVGPANMSRETVNKIHAAMDAALKQKEVVEKFALAATIPLFLTPEQLKSLIVTETGKWLQLAREAHIQPE